MSNPEYTGLVRWYSFIIGIMSNISQNLIIDYAGLVEWYVTLNHIIHQEEDVRDRLNLIMEAWSCCTSW